MGILRSWGRWIGVRVRGDALSVGCGEGELPALLEPEGLRVVEVEPRRATDLPYEDASFDTVLLGDFLADRVSAGGPIAEARRVLRPGGRLIVAAPYLGNVDDDVGLSQEVLLGDLAEFAVEEVEVVDDRICIVAKRGRDKSRARAWRRALTVAERRLAEQNQVVELLRASASDLEHRRQAEERSLLAARGDVERLETALASIGHQRDRHEEDARLAREGVAALQQRLERSAKEHSVDLAKTEREHSTELAKTEKELIAAQADLTARERELEQSRTVEREARAKLDERQAKLDEQQGKLEEQQAKLDELAKARAALMETLGKREREVAALERDLADRVRALGKAGERLTVLEKELHTASESLSSNQAERRRVEERAAAAEHELETMRSRLQAREQHLQNAQTGIESRDRRLETAEQALESREAELRRLRGSSRDQERKLALAEARLEKSEARAERFRGSLVALRAGRSYRLMRVLWRLRRPFRRASRDPLDRGTADEEPGPRVSPPPADIPVARPRPIPPPREPRRRPVVASILDEMSAACFAPECDLVPLTLDGWREQLDERRPDLLLAESAWNANDGEWQYRIAAYPRKDLLGLPALRELLAGCRERGIPTAFWNKEDPVHFERFAEAAACFDHVFTTDARCVQRYLDLPGGERTVTPLPFAAQPRIHNPVAAVPERSTSPCFAGAWYRDRHPERRRALEALLDAARPYGLVIYDRRFGGEDSAFGFPDRFQPHVLGSLPYDRILDVYKSHRVFLNANSVVDSPTMCSRRVFELAACDTAIVSTPGAALPALLGEGVVAEADDERGGAEALEQLLEDDGERRRRTRAARRTVLAEHTYAERLATIAETAGLDPSSLRRPPFDGGESPARAGDYPWLLTMQPGVQLSPPTLADLRAAAIYADADVIGTHPANGTAAIEHRHVADLDPRALLLRRDFAEARGPLPDDPDQARARLREWHDQGTRLYAADADLL